MLKNRKFENGLRTSQTEPILPIAHFFFPKQEMQNYYLIINGKVNNFITMKDGKKYILNG